MKRKTSRFKKIQPLLFSGVLIALYGLPSISFGGVVEKTQGGWAELNGDFRRHYPFFINEKHFVDSKKNHKKLDSPEILGSIDGVGIYPRSINVSDKFNKLYAISPYDGYVTIVDGKTNAVEGSVFTNTDPNYAVIDDRNNRLYVLSDGSSQIITVDTKTNQVIDSPIPIGNPHIPTGCNNFDDPCTDQGSDSYTIALNHKTNKIYVGNIMDKTVSVVDLKKQQVTKTIPIGASAYLVSVNEKTNKIYVATGSSATVVVIDGHTNQILKSIPIGFPALPNNCYDTFTCEEWGSFSFNIAINENTNKIYAVNSFSGDMVVIDGNTDSAIGSQVKIGRSADFLTVDESTNSIYVGDMLDATLTIVDGKTNNIFGSPIVLGGPASPSGCSFLNCIDYPSALTEIAMNHKTNKIYVLNQETSGVVNIVDGNIKRPKTTPVKHENLRITLHDLGLLQLVIHDIYNVDRTTEINSEDGRLNLSTVLDHGYANIANGGDFRNMENPATLTVAKQYGQQYLDLIAAGNTPENARNTVVTDFLAAVKKAYENTFSVPFPHASSSEDSGDLNGDLAFRTLHDLIPGKIIVNGVKKSLLDPSLAGQTLSAQDMQQLSSPLDGQYDPELSDMVNPMNGEHIDLLERDSSFASQFHTTYSFEQLLAGQTDGDFDSFDLSSILMWKALSSAQRPISAAASLSQP